MSHFFTVVIVPKMAEKNKTIEQTAQELLKPFYTGIEVEEYNKDCYCIGEIARHDAETKMQKEMGTWDEARKRFKGSQKKWEKEVYEPRNKRVQELVRKHFMRGKPDPKCSECKGTGKFKSTFNPKSKWDWWVIGGRWDGTIVNDYKSSEEGFNFGEQHHQLDHNVVRIKELLDKKGNIKVVPHAIITPRGKWIEKGSMGWWGISSGTKKEDDWKTIVVEIYKKYKDNLGVGCDLHI